MGTEFSFELKLWVEGPTIEEARGKLLEIISTLFFQNKIQDYDIYK